MKYIIILLFILSSRVFAQEILFDSSTLIRNTEGGYINLVTFDSIMSTNAYTLKVVTNEDRLLKHLQILKKTEADYAFEKEQADFAKKSSSFVRKAPYFEVKTNKGETFALNKNKVTFMHFWSGDIEVSQKYIPELNELYNIFKDNENVSFLSVNTDENLTETEKENVASNIDLPLVFEAKKKIKGYGFEIKTIPIEAIVPKYYVVNKKREIVFISANFRDVDFFQKMITVELEKPAENE